MQRLCFPGSIQPSAGQHRCELCPSRFFCPENGKCFNKLTNSVPYVFSYWCFLILGMTYPNPCQPGFYCPIGSANQHPCPSGSYGNQSELAESSECTLCDPGAYCMGSGMTNDCCPQKEHINLVWAFAADIYLSVQEIFPRLALAVQVSCVLEAHRFRHQPIMRLECRAPPVLTVLLEVLHLYIVLRAHLGKTWNV